MTNDEVRSHIQNYRGNPFLIGEYARELGITWHRMRRIVRAMVQDGELQELPGFSHVFYSPIRPMENARQRELRQEMARRRAAWAEDFL